MTAVEIILASKQALPQQSDLCLGTAPGMTSHPTIPSLLLLHGFCSVTESEVTHF